MNIIYIKREIKVSSLLGEEPSSDVKELIQFFKSLTFRYKKSENDVETWYDENDQWTIQICEEKWEYSKICYKNGIF
jgi:hypothetical protein